MDRNYIFLSGQVSADILHLLNVILKTFELVQNLTVVVLTKVWQTIEALFLFPLPSFTLPMAEKDYRRKKICQNQTSRIPPFENSNPDKKTLADLKVARRAKKGPPHPREIVV